MTSILRKLDFGRSIGPECPSELHLDRLYFGELDGEHPVSAHVGTCDACRQRMTARAQPMAAELSGRMLAEIHLGVSNREMTERWLDRLLRWMAPVRHYAVVAAVAVLVFVLMPQRERGEAGEAVRSKGGLGLVVYRERSGTVDKMLSGEEFQPGDRLRFEVDLPRPGQLMIVGVEADGDTFPCYTGEGTQSAAEVGAEKKILPGAVELDDSRGKEQLHAILCSERFSFEEVAIKDGRVVSPPDCVSTPFLLNKELLE